MTEIIGFVVGVTLWLILFTILDRRFTCKCGRDVFPYFAWTHERGGLMLFYCVFFTSVFVVHLFFDPSMIYIAFMVPLLSWYWLRWWKHESGKIKKAAKGLGRIFVNEHGRLKVAYNA
jgi:hypothetical protein